MIISFVIVFWEGELIFKVLVLMFNVYVIIILWVYWCMVSCYDVYELFKINSFFFMYFNLDSNLDRFWYIGMK